MCTKSLLGLPSVPSLPPVPAPVQLEDEKPAVFEAGGETATKRGRNKLKRDDLTANSATGLSIPVG